MTGSVTGSGTAAPKADPPLQEKVDFYYDENGLMVFTETYHLKRGYCCESGCRHCPYGNDPQRRL